MKKININHITLANKSSHLIKQKSHCVSLGNGSKNYFSNINKAKEFLAQTNRFLNERYFDINELYIDVFVHFQRNWFYFENNSKSEKYEYDCRRKFENIKTIMQMAFDRSHYKNGNHFAFRHTYNICDTLIEIVVMLRKVHVLRGNYAEAYTMDAISRRIDFVKILLDKYPNLDFCNHNEIPEEDSGIGTEEY